MLQFVVQDPWQQTNSIASKCRRSASKANSSLSVYFQSPSANIPMSVGFWLTCDIQANEATQAMVAAAKTQVEQAELN